jgi:hypothetical protein
VSSNQVAPAKWTCPKCGVGIPYNPSYSMDNVLCSTCAAYQNSDRLLSGYRWKPRHSDHGKFAREVGREIAKDIGGL